MPTPRPPSDFAVDTTIIIIIFDPGAQLTGNEKNTLCNTKKYKNQAGMNLTPHPPSQNSHAVLLLLLLLLLFIIIIIIMKLAQEYMWIHT